MRIRKTSTPSALPLDTAQVVDSYSTSTTDAYSCNFVNSQAIESGSNYIKYYDGTMICWGSYKGSLSSDGQSDGLYYTSHAFTFPVAFTSTPVIVPSVIPQSGMFLAGIDNASHTSSSQTKIRVFNHLTWSNRSMTISYIAIGKWK